jgi:hypothetical protein
MNTRPLEFISPVTLNEDARNVDASLDPGTDEEEEDELETEEGP